MTAEVAIINRTAIAVAADSAVTVGGKVHRSTTKIFAISEDIGAMIHGYSELGGLSWEVLLKLFRKEHGRDSFATVQECYKAVRAFLNENRFRLETESMESLVRFSIQIIEYVGDRVSDLDQGERTLENVRAIIDDEIRQYKESEGALDFVCPDFQTFQQDAKEIVDSVVENVFEELKTKESYELPSELQAKFIELVHTALNSRYISEYASGLVIFGFGKDELFPQLIHYAFDTVSFGALRTVFVRSIDVIANGPTIVPFAAREVMDSIIQGVVPGLQDFYVESISVIANEVAERIVEENLHSDDHLVANDMAKRRIADVVERFREESDDYVRGRYVHPMIDIIGSMPKDEIAVLAEALVEVTALRIKASKTVESVAEPVDVCVVTKGDGLIWTRRKHYFDLNKNLQYLYRRFGIPPAILRESKNAPE